MTNYKAYMEKLRPLYYTLDDKMEKAIFKYVSWAYFYYHEGKRKSKKVPKKELLQYLVSSNLMSMKKNKSTGENELPNDRKVREIARKLLKQGYPIMADSTASGYYIADNLSEIERPRKENEKRAKMILEVGQGYNKVAQLIQYDRRLN